MWDNIKKEPALVTAVIAAVIAVAVGFGLGWTGAQVALVMTAVAAVQGLFVRSKVTPVVAPLFEE